ncbi:MAG: hypothetical protein HN855_00430 [Anaerolineae bacterium]|jgi:hypothetical protein|nr:hypothetical protein [Anaerolineae bacterium]MBT7070054.1 hypothetical protein [Anaerolineae bacterium]MBT7323607.1 hypothetical protein [Anaerolineae bacterium]
MTEERTEPTQTEEKDEKNSTSEQRGAIIGVVIFLVIVIGLFVWGIIALFQAEPTQTAKVRDIFIIVMAFESLLIGAALIILIVQIASLMNLLQNEIKPIMDATNETVHTLRGTTAFLSENMIEPVVKLNANLAGLQRVLELLGIKRKIN